MHTPCFRNFDLLHQKYLVEGLSLRQIATDFLSSKEAVRKGLLDFGIPLREAHQPHGRQSQTKYGSIRKSGVLADQKQEQRIIRAVRELRERGLSLRQIASTLSTMGIPTKCQGQKWHPQMVSRILTIYSSTWPSEK